MLRKDNENYLSYAKRLTNALECGMIDYDEWGDYLLGVENNYSRENLRKAYYVVSKILPNFEDCVEYTNDDLLQELKLQKDEIYKEKIKLRDERRMKNNELRVQARYENLLDVMIDAIHNSFEIKLNETTLNKDSNVEAVLDFSDFHYGLLVDNVLNYYDTDVAKQRVEILSSKVIHYCSIHRVNKLHINLIGDLISGVIKIQHKVDAEEDVITQIINCSKILSEFINTIHKHVPNIEVYGVVGNHSRLNENKKMNMPAENFERLIFEYIKTTLPNVNVHINGMEDWIVYKVKNKEIFATHGDKDTIVNAKSHVVNILGRKVDEIHMGHVHHFNIKDDNGTLIVVNGSIISTEDYSVSLRCHTQPYQLLSIYDKDVCIYKLELN